MRMIIADCTVEYSGRLKTRLPFGRRLILVKDDGTILIHSDKGAKQLNWMSPPNIITETRPKRRRGRPSKKPIVLTGDVPVLIWLVNNLKTGEILVINFETIHSDDHHPLGDEPGLVKDGVEEQLQTILADNPEILEPELSLITREARTPIGPIDILYRDHSTGGTIACEVKRNGHLSGVHQLIRYMMFLSRDDDLIPVKGLYVAQKVTKQAKTLCDDQNVEWRIVNYDKLKEEYGT